MGDTPIEPEDAHSSGKKTDGTGREPPPPPRGDHPMFQGPPDFMPMLRKKHGDDF